MKRQAFLGGWYADATPDGNFAVLFPDAHISHAGGWLSLPPAGNLLFTVTNGKQIAGQGHHDGQCWLWTGSMWLNVGPTYGTSPCAFGPLGLYVSMPGAAANVAVVNPETGGKSFPVTQVIGVRGIAAVDASGIHPQDDWYGQFGLGEYVDLGFIQVGQSIHGGCAIQGHLLEPGDVQFIRAHRDGDLISVAMWKPQEKQAVCHWLTVAEIAQLPIVGTTPPNPGPQPEPPKPEPPKPMPQGITDEQFAILQAVRAKYPETLNESQGGRYINEACYAAGLGMQRKDAGTASIQPKTGIRIWNGVRFIRDGQHYGQDVFAAASVGKFQPTRGEVGLADPNTYIAPVQPEDVTPEPQPDPKPEPSPDLSEITQQIATLKDALKRCCDDIEELIDDNKELVQRVIELEHKKLPKLRVKGNTSREWGHGHRVDLEVVPE